MTMIKTMVYNSQKLLEDNKEVGRMIVAQKAFVEASGLMKGLPKELLQTGRVVEVPLLLLREQNKIV